MSDAVRLAYLCSDPGIAFDGTKGASVHLREMARALRAEGALLDVFVGRGKAGAVPGVRVVRARDEAGADRELQLLAANASMHEALEAAGPHDAVYERLSLFGVAGAAYARLHGLPHIVEVNAPLWDEAARFRTLSLRNTAKAMALDVLQAATRVVTVSAELRRILIAAGVAADRVSVLPNRVNRHLFEAAAPAPRPPLSGERLLLFVGSLKPWHGVEFLLEAFERCRRDLPVSLWIVGEGPVGEHVAAARDAAPDRIHWTPGVAHDEIPGILKTADIAVAPYPADAPAYFCPMKVIEAMALGRPVLASDTTCVADVVRGYPHARLFAPSDHASFAAALRDLLAGPRVAPASSVPMELSWRGNACMVLQWIDTGVTT